MPIMTDAFKALCTTASPEEVLIDTIELTYPSGLGVWRLCSNDTAITKKIEDGTTVEFIPYNFTVGFPKEDEHMDYAFPVGIDASDKSVYEEFNNYLNTSNEAISFVYRAYLEDEDEPQKSTHGIPYNLYNPQFDFTNNTMMLKGALPDFINQTLSGKKYNTVDFPSLEYVYG